MWDDPIIEEIRRFREAKAAKFGFNMQAIFDDMIKRQAKSGHRVVDLSKKHRTSGLRKGKSGVKLAAPRKRVKSKAG